MGVMQRGACAALMACGVAAAGAQLAGSRQAAASCDEFMVPKYQVDGKAVGQERCRMMEHPVTLDGRTYRRIDIGITGTIEGYTPTEGLRASYFTTEPDFVFIQVGNRLEVASGDRTLRGRQGERDRPSLSGGAAPGTAGCGSPRTAPARRSAKAR